MGAVLQKRLGNHIRPPEWIAAPSDVQDSVLGPDVEELYEKLVIERRDHRAEGVPERQRSANRANLHIQRL